MTAAPSQSLAKPSAPPAPRDPVWWSGALACAFLALVLWRLGIPSKIYFDEVHYVPAARTLLAMTKVVNQEHPMLGKELIAASIALFGDNPAGWRTLPALAGGISLFAFMRALWFATCSRFAALAGGVLLASNFLLFIQSRIAMLDVFMVMFVMIGLWMGAAALREPAGARWRLALAGAAMGLAMASKWSAVLVAMVPGLMFLAFRLKASGRRFLTDRMAAPVPGMALWEAGIWLGLVPLLAYALTFLPVFFYAQGPLTLGTFVAYHQHMLELQGSVISPHTYQSQWQDWVINWRAIWYLYEPVDGAQRGVVLIGNPLTMLMGLVALVWCGWQAARHRNMAAMGALALYLASIGLWVVAPKPVQFYYHYVLPGSLLMAPLALMLDHGWQAGRRWMPLGTLAAALGLFVWFYPIISSAPLAAGERAFEQWMWLASWR